MINIPLYRLWSCLITAVALLGVPSCKKGKFPDTNELKGSWVEQGNPNFSHKLIFKNDILLFVKSTKTDTLFYNLDKEKKALSLTVVNSSSGISTEHKIVINKKKKELTIWGLFVGINTSETTFKKE